MSVTLRATAPASTESDADLMGRVQQDDSEAFALLYDRHAARAYRVARSVCHRSGSAEEAVQEAFISIWRSRLTYRRRSEGFAAWAMTIVRDRAVDVARREAVHDRRSTDARSEDASSPIDMRGLLAALPDEQCEVITLAYYGQLSHTEIAAHLGLPEGTVEGRMRLGLEKLNNAMA